MRDIEKTTPGQQALLAAMWVTRMADKVLDAEEKTGGPVQVETYCEGAKPDEICQIQRLVEQVRGKDDREILEMYVTFMQHVLDAVFESGAVPGPAAQAVRGTSAQSETPESLIERCGLKKT